MKTSKLLQLLFSKMLAENKGKSMISNHYKRFCMSWAISRSLICIQSTSMWSTTQEIEKVMTKMANSMFDKKNRDRYVPSTPMAPGSCFVSLHDILSRYHWFMSLTASIGDMVNYLMSLYSLLIMTFWWFYACIY